MGCRKSAFGAVSLAGAVCNQDSASLMKPFDLTVCCQQVGKGSLRKVQYANRPPVSHIPPQGDDDIEVCISQDRAGTISPSCVKHELGTIASADVLLPAEPVPQLDFRDGTAAP